MPDSTAVDKEKHTKQLKRKIECWREAILPLNSILLWERSWYPGLIFGFTTFIFLLIWTLQPAFLTIISLSLLVFALIDYLVPLLTSILCPANSWTGQKEKKLNEICQSLSSAILYLSHLWKSILQIRNNRPNVYYGVTILCLILCAWLGNTIDNLLLSYIAVNTLLLTPGLRHQRRAEWAMKYIYDYVTHRKLL